MKDHEFDIGRTGRFIKQLREDVIQMTHIARSGHPGGSLSAADVVGYLYDYRLHIDPSDPHKQDRDRFILSKGHCAPILYAALAESGYFDRDVLWTLRDIGSKLQGHPDMRKTPGIDMTTGSLGMGLSCGVGMALGAKLNHYDSRVFVMTGDGEMQCGQIWEAAMTAKNHSLDNLTLIVDKNGYQCDGEVDCICALGDLCEKLRAFGWACYEIDGHDLAQIHDAFERCKSVQGQPQAIVARTVKGKGVSFMEGDNRWHGTAPTVLQRDIAISEIWGE